MAKIHGMMLVRNEADRWLINVISQMKAVCKRVVVLDDDSTDNTPTKAMSFGCEVYHSEQSLWGKNELIQRKKLWDLTIKEAKHGDWILCLDADELFVYDHLSYIKYVFNSVSPDVDAIGFRLHDMWSDTHYREDASWQAHFHFWPMAIRYDDNRKYEWIDKPLHCGRFPKNGALRMLPTMIPIKHMGWSREEDRIKKYSRYMEIDPEGKNGILAQYKSIVDAKPSLKLFGGE